MKYRCLSALACLSFVSTATAQIELGITAGVTSFEWLEFIQDGDVILPLDSELLAVEEKGSLKNTGLQLSLGSIELRYNRTFGSVNYRGLPQSIPTLGSIKYRPSQTDYTIQNLSLAYRYRAPLPMSGLHIFGDAQLSYQKRERTILPGEHFYDAPDEDMRFTNKGVGLGLTYSPYQQVLLESAILLLHSFNATQHATLRNGTGEATSSAYSFDLEPLTTTQLSIIAAYSPHENTTIKLSIGYALSDLRRSEGGGARQPRSEQSQSSINLAYTIKLAQ